MSTPKLRRGTAVVWTNRDTNLGASKVVLGIVQAPEDADQVTIEVVEPNEDEKVIVTVPVEQVRHLRKGFTVGRA